MEENCVMRGSGKSVVCKEDWSRLTISEIKVPKSGFDEVAGVTYTYFKISVVLREVEFEADLTDDLKIQITVDDCMVEQRMDCDMKKFHSNEHAKCKKNIDSTPVPSAAPSAAPSVSLNPSFCNGGGQCNRQLRALRDGGFFNLCQGQTNTDKCGALLRLIEEVIDCNAYPVGFGEEPVCTASAAGDCTKNAPG
eukprot:evm.model.NODE_22133_length_4647_cov_25.117495.1